MFNANVAPAVLTASLQKTLLDIDGNIHLTSGFDDICGGYLVCTPLLHFEYRQGHIDFK